MKIHILHKTLTLSFNNLFKSRFQRRLEAMTQEEFMAFSADKPSLSVLKSDQLIDLGNELTRRLGMTLSGSTAKKEIELHILSFRTTKKGSEPK